MQSAEFVGVGMRRGRTPASLIPSVGKAIVSYDDAKERILFKFEKALPVGQGKLKVAFTGTLNDKLKGCDSPSSASALSASHTRQLLPQQVQHQWRRSLHGRHSVRARRCSPRLPVLG